MIVVGGGAAGMMAAVAAADAGARVRLLEQNEKLGKKLFITGKGRCNVTNAGEREQLLANVVTNSKFLYSAFGCFDNRAVMELLEAEGCPLKIERGERVFPVSDHSSDVIAALTRALKRRQVEICLHTQVRSLWWEEAQATSLEPVENSGKKAKAYRGSIRGVQLADGRRLAAEKVILATGGLSYAATGSTGDGHNFARETGHDLTVCRPSLVPLRIREDWCRELMGLSLRNVSLSLRQRGRELYSGFGEMLFTHFGISGPLVLSASSYYAAQAQGEAAAFLDLKPAMDKQQLDKRVLRDLEENRNKQFKNALGRLFPAKLIPVMVRLSGICPDKQAGEVTRQERIAFVELIKALPMTVMGVQGYEEAVITKGGVSVRDVNPSTMESRKVRGLYFAGELLDLDALTGGYNLQIAWSTGHLAGSSAAGIE